MVRRNVRQVFIAKRLLEILYSQFIAFPGFLIWFGVNLNKLFDGIFKPGLLLFLLDIQKLAFCYIRMNPGWLYLVAVLDWYSRYVVSWSLSNSLDVFFCLEALEQALTKNKPDIFNPDQGSQFTSGDFTGRLEKAGIQISMDGRGRVYDNIYVERLWRTVKYEEIYLHDYQSVREAREQLGNYFRFYNEERFHSSLGCRPPADIYFGRKEN